MNVMKKITLFMSCLLLLLVAQQAQAGVFRVRSAFPQNVYVYGFKGSGDNVEEVYQRWPGILLTTPSLGNYSSETGVYTFSESTGATIILNNGIGGQGQSGNFAPGDYNVIYPKPDGKGNYDWGNYETLCFDYTIVGGEALTGADWSTAQGAGNDMTPNDGIYTLEKTIELNKGDYEYKVVGDHSFNHVFPTGDNYRLSIPKQAQYKVTFTFNPATFELRAVAEEIPVEITSYTIIGTKELLGTDVDDAIVAANDMTNNEGTWTLVKENVELQPGNYAYKVVGNYDASVFSYPENPNSLNIPKHAIYNVTFTFNPTTNELNATATVVQDIYVLRYGHDADQNHESSNWTDVTFAQGTGDNEGKLVATVNFPAGDEFVINEGNNWYHPASNDYHTRLVDFFNCEGISLSTDQNGNFHINDAGEYTFVLYKDENNNLKLDVQTFTEPPIYLQYGKDDPEIGWQNVVFESEARGNERRFMASINNFPASDEFVIHYGSRWYGSKQSSLEEVDYDHFELTLSNGTEGHQNFVINKTGNYTFMLTLGETNTLVVNGFEEPPFMLEYGVAGQDWASVQFVEGEGGTLVATVPDGFPAGNDFLITKGEGNKKVYYGAGAQADNLVDYFNSEITLFAEGHQNLHITEGGNYTFVLSFNDDNLLLNVQGFTKPDYVLKYGAAGAQNWSGLETFVLGEEGQLVVSDVEFSANDEFVITYGRYKYSSNAEGDFWLVDRQNCTNLSLIRDGKNFRFDEAGTYTFEMILDENEFPATLNITGFTPPAYKLSYGVPNETWNEMTFEEDESGKLVATVNSFPANNEFLVIYCEGNKKVYYGAARNADNLVDYFNPNITLVTEGHQNLHITEGGNYTFVLTLNDQGYPASISVSEFTEPNYVLSYGQANQDWTDVPFTNSEGKITAADVQFPANTEFLIKYGRYTYGGATGESVYKINSEWCTDIGITDTGYKPFLIEDAGTYTFEITITSNDEGVSKSITVTGWPEPVVIESYTVAGTKELLGTEEDWAIVEANDMTVDNGIWTLVKENVELEPGVTYEYKVAGNHDFATWVFPADHNKTLTVDKHGLYKVTFTLNPETPELTAVVELTQEILPDYVLHYGKGNNWQTKTFVNGTSTYQGKLVVTGLVFEQYTEFGVKYGNTWYGGFSDQNYYDIHSNHHEGIVLSTGSNVKNFRIQEAGNYVIVLYTDPADSKLKIDVIYPIRGDVTGDGLVDTSDVNAVVNIILSKASQADYPGNANIVEKEGDPQGKVDVSDLNAIVNIILGKSIE